MAETNLKSVTLTDLRFVSAITKQVENCNVHSIVIQLYHIFKNIFMHIFKLLTILIRDVIFLLGHAPSPFCKILFFV